MTRNSLITWTPVGLVLLLAGLTFWLTKAVEIKASDPTAAVRHEPDIVLERFVAQQLGLDGKARYTLSANKMQHFRDDDSTELETVDFLATERETAPLRVESARARLTSKADEIFFSDRVLITREAFGGYGRMTAETSYLHVIPDAGIGKTDKPVVMREGMNTLTANGMEINNKTRVAVLTRVKATYYAAK